MNLFDKAKIVINIRYCVWVISGIIIILSMPSCSQETLEFDCTQTSINFKSTVKDAACGISEGEIVITNESDVSLEKYKLNDNPFQTSNVFRDLKPGKYVVTVVDENGCDQSSSVLINSGISYSNSIKPILEKSCIIPACHDGSGNIDFRVFSNLNPSDIKGRTQSGNMPKDGTLTEEEIEKIACWVDDGALEN